MSANPEVIASRQWLRRTLNALEDACTDFQYSLSNNGVPIDLSFDPSIIFPSLSVRNNLNITDPTQWLDISAAVVINNLKKYRPELLGYRLIMPQATFLTILRNYNIDNDLVAKASEAKTDEEVFSLLSSKLGQISKEQMLNKNYIVDLIQTFIEHSQKRHNRLLRLRDYLHDHTILPDVDVFDTDERRRTMATQTEFLNLRRRITEHAQAIELARQSPSSFHNQDSPDIFIRGVEAMEFITARKLTDLLGQGHAHKFLAFPSIRSFYDNPSQYHRVITSVLFKLICLSETPSSSNLLQGAYSHLTDYRDTVRFLYRKVSDHEKAGEPLSPLLIRAITAFRNEHLRHLSGELKIMNEEEREKLVQGFKGTRKQVYGALRDAVVVARDINKDSATILAEMAEQFRLFETVAGWEELPPTDPIRQFVSTLKPAPK